MGRQHAGLNGRDIVAEMIERCHQRGIAVVQPAVEATLFHQPDRSRYVLSLVNFQHDLPNVPVEGIEVHLRLPQRVKSVRVLPSGSPLRIRREENSVIFTAPRLDTLLMLAANHA